MNTNLFLQSLTKFLLGVIILGLLIFPPLAVIDHGSGSMLIVFLPTL